MVTISVRRRRKVIVGAFFFCLSLSACAAGAASKPAAQAFVSPDAVIAAMNTAGITCRGGQIPLDDPKPTIRASSCMLYTESGEWSGAVKVMTSTASAEELYDAEVAFYRQPEITAMTTFPIWIAQGDRWTVSCGGGKDQAERIAAALGGKAVSIAA
ncbi:hypothetical protein [Streptosporangium sandarakinum]|uniref:hypothetical protein n=1 Tax=Streptosporangium sandarakinum TaxID=1260955 RepID=UPI00378BD73A